MAATVPIQWLGEMPVGLRNLSSSRTRRTNSSLLLSVMLALARANLLRH